MLSIPSSPCTVQFKKMNECEYSLEITLREKCPYLELFWSAFSRVWTEYGEILRISTYSIRIRENTDQNNSENGHFLRSVIIVPRTHN